MTRFLLAALLLALNANALAVPRPEAAGVVGEAQPPLYQDRPVQQQQDDNNVYHLHTYDTRDDGGVGSQPAAPAADGQKPDANGLC